MNTCSKIWIVRRLAFHFLALFLLLPALFYCDNKGEGSVSYIDYVPENPVPAYLEQTNNALAAWDINLQTGVLGTSRNIRPGYQANPPNWVTVASQADCDALGIPLDQRQEGEECALKGDFVGVCLVHVYESGPNAGIIVDSTVIIERETLNGFSTAMGGLDMMKGLITHEIGHCLGLQHWGAALGADEDSDAEFGNDTDHQTHIMYPALTARVVPDDDEKAAIQEIYASSGCSRGDLEQNCTAPHTLSDAGNCGTSTSVMSHTAYEALIPCYYTPVSDEDLSPPPRFHQPRFPTFYISASIGNAGMRGEILPPGPPLEGEVSTHIYEIKIDGQERLRRIDPRGKKTVSELWSTP